MDFYRFCISEYRRTTRKLNLYQDIAYRRLIDLYVETEAPITGSVKEIAEMISMSGYEKDIDLVLGTLFSFLDGVGWLHVGMDTQISKLLSANKKRALAKKQYWVRKNETQIPSPIDQDKENYIDIDVGMDVYTRARNIEDNIYNNIYNINNNTITSLLSEDNLEYNTSFEGGMGESFKNNIQDSKSKHYGKSSLHCDIYKIPKILEEEQCCKIEKEDDYKVDFKSTSSRLPEKILSTSSSHKPFDVMNVQKPEDVDEEIWMAYKKLRDRKKSPLTSIALKKLRKEVEKCNLSMNEALEEMCLRGWIGIKREWLEQSRKVTNNNHIRPMQVNQIHHVNSGEVEV